MKDLAKVRLAWTARAARFAFIAWTLVQPAAGQQLHSELRKGGYIICFRHTSTDQGLSQGWPRSALWPERDEC